MASGKVSRLILLVAVQFAVVYGAQFGGAPDITEGLLWNLSCSFSLLFSLHWNVI